MTRIGPPQQTSTVPSIRRSAASCGRGELTKLISTPSAAKAPRAKRDVERRVEDRAQGFLEG